MSADTQTNSVQTTHPLVHALRWALPFFAALLPIVLLSIYALQIASSSVKVLVESTNLSAAANVSQLLTDDITQMVRLGHAVASVPGTTEAAKTQDALTMNIRLKALVLAYPHIQRAFMTNSGGLLWSDYPAVPGSYGKDHTDTEWYKELSKDWKPYVSGVYVPYEGAKSPAVAIAVPVMSEGSGAVLGTLVLEYRTEEIVRWLQNIHLGKSGYVYVVDQHGMVVAHPHLASTDQLYDFYKDITPIRQASTLSMESYRDPFMQADMLATFQPISVGGYDWTIVAGQPESEAYQPLRSVIFRISIAGGVLTLLTLGMVIALGMMSLKNQRLTIALSAKNKTLQDITSFVSHQLRAPVTAMRWTIESMLDGDYGTFDESLKEPLNSLKDVAIQNGDLINDILNVSRIDRGVIDVAVAAVSLSEIADRALRDYRIALEKAGLSLTVKDDKTITVLADKEKMAEAVTNSISNAIKHTKTGGITITLRKDEHFGYIDVSDTGEGMTQDIIDKLFDRAGVKGSNTDSAASTGLGLYIARNFMKLQKGDITVASTPGKGSIFTYSVPLTHL